MTNNSISVCQRKFEFVLSHNFQYCEKTTLFYTVYDIEKLILMNKMHL